MTNITNPDQTKPGDRVRHLYEEGTVVQVSADEVLVHYEHGPRGTWHGPQKLVVAVYDHAWFAAYPHKLHHAPPRGGGQDVVDYGRKVDAGARLTPIIQHMNAEFNGRPAPRDLKYGCLAIVWPLDRSQEHYVLANHVATPELRAVLVDLLTKIDRDLRHGG